MAKTTILICDDEEGIRRYLQKLLVSQGFDVQTFSSGIELLDRLKRGALHEAALLIQDVRMPDMDGIEVLKGVKSIRPELPVIIMTAFGTIDAAVETVKIGAYDYITKPFPKEKILGVIDNALERELLRTENRQLKEKLNLSVENDGSPIIFASDTFREVYDLTLQVAKSDANILILGESGTGKELIAQAVHRHSARRSQKFLSINCAALSDTLLESQLFGHLRGAFTGAVSNQQGILEEADGGTLFMDEIGDMSLPIQAKLLRVIQERDFMPVGSTKTKTIDIRFVAATNKNLEDEVKSGRFREDLFYRLNVISIHLPPLRERREDIPPLANHFLRKFSRRMKKEVAGISPAALESLCEYGWPGNIRELENVLERAVILARTDMITPDLLPILKQRNSRSTVTAVRLQSLDAIEKDHIQKTFAQTGFHKSRAAEVLGISRKTLDRKIAEYELDIS